MPARNLIFNLGLTVAGLVLGTWVLAVILGMAWEAQTNQAKQKITRVDQSLQSGETALIHDQYLALERVAGHMESLRQNRFVFIPTWNIIRQSVPNDVQLTSISMTQDHTFRVSGISQSIGAVAIFAESLNDKTQITQVTPLSVGRQGGSVLMDFNLTFQVNPNRAQAEAGGSQ